MTIITAFIYAIEFLIVIWYITFPLCMGHKSFFHYEFHNFLSFKQSLALNMVISPARISFFTYIRTSNQHVPATRCFVFFAFLGESILATFSLLQCVVYWENPNSFAHYRKDEWANMYLCTLWGLIAFASLSELGYILRLNKGKGHGFEEGFMRDILTSDLTHTLKKQAIWTKKWTQLVKQFKRKQTEPTFEALVRLYAHREGEWNVICIVWVLTQQVGRRNEAIGCRVCMGSGRVWVLFATIMQLFASRRFQTRTSTLGHSTEQMQRVRGYMG